MKDQVTCGSHNALHNRLYASGEDIILGILMEVRVFNHFGETELKQLVRSHVRGLKPIFCYLDGQD